MKSTNGAPQECLCCRPRDDIDVEVDNGIAYPGGRVNRWAERAEAGHLASHIAGARQVHNNLRVGHDPYSWAEWDEDCDFPYGL